MNGFRDHLELFKPPHITLNNWRDADHIKWSLSHLSFMPCLDVARAGPVSALPNNRRDDIEAFGFDYDETQMSFLEALQGDSADGCIVIKDGSVLYERYFGAFRAYDKHFWASASKSLLGTLFGVLVKDYDVDLETSPAEILPQLASSGFAHATLRETLNMVCALDFTEELDDLPPGSVHSEYFRRLGLMPAWDLMQVDPRLSSIPRTVRAYLPEFTLKPGARRGEVFEYQSPIVDVLGWVIETITDMPLAEFIRTRLWAKLQTEHDAFVGADVAFNAIATGGMNSTLRDAARFGLMVLNEGRVGDEQIVDAGWIRDTYQLSEFDKAAWARSAYADQNSETYMPDYEGYHSLWWVNDAEAGERTASGIYGQLIYINKAKSVVIVVFSSPYGNPKNMSRKSLKRVIRANRSLASVL